MNRRRFFSLLGAGAAGIALEQAIPFGRVWSFPTQLTIAEPTTLRFIRALDPFSRRVLNRIDVLYGFAALPPAGLTYQQTVVRRSQLPEALSALSKRFNVPGAPIPACLFEPEGSGAQLRGIHWYELDRDDPRPSIYGVSR